MRLCVHMCAVWCVCMKSNYNIQNSMKYYISLPAATTVANINNNNNNTKEEKKLGNKKNNDARIFLFFLLFVLCFAVALTASGVVLSFSAPANIFPNERLILICNNIHWMRIVHSHTQIAIWYDVVIAYAFALHSRNLILYCLRVFFMCVCVSLIYFSFSSIELSACTCAFCFYTLFVTHILSPRVLSCVGCFSLSSPLFKLWQCTGNYVDLVHL